MPIIRQVFDLLNCFSKRAYLKIITIFAVIDCFFIASATTSGNQIILNSLAAQYYPVPLRTTGFGWALDIGRIGAITGPTLVDFLVGLKLPFEQNFFAFALAAGIAAVAITFVDYQRNVK